MAEDSSTSHASPARLSGASGSSSGSMVAGTPLELKPEVFQDLFEAALGFNVLKYEALMESFPPLKVFNAMKDDPKRIADIVHKMIGTDPDLVLKRFDPERYADDISAYIEGNDERAKRFINLVGMEFYQKAMGPLDIYTVVMGTGWMMHDTPITRGFAAQLCVLLEKHKAFGEPPETQYAIMKAIGTDVFVSDLIPEDIRMKLWLAVMKGARRYGGKAPWEYMFDEAVGGVPYKDIAMIRQLKLDQLGNPFAVYISRTGLLKTDVDKPSVPAPPDAIVEDARTSGFAVGPFGPPPLPMLPRPDKPPTSD